MHPRVFASLLAVLCVSSASHQAATAGSESILRDPAAPPVWLGQHAALAVDVDPALTVEDVLQGRVQFRRYGSERPSFRLGAGVIWMRLVVQAEAAAMREPWVLAFDHPRPRGVTLYWRGVDGRLASRRGGLSLPAAQHAVRSRSVTLPLPLERPGEQTFFVRLEAYPVGFSGQLLPAARLHEGEAFGAAALGLYYGGALALLAYNLVLFVLLRRRPYLLFGGLAICHILFFLGRNGWFWRLGLWSATPRHVGGLISSLNVMLLVLFTLDVLSTRATAPRLHRVGRWVIGAAGLNLLLAAAGLGKVTDPFGALLGLLGALLVATIAVRQWLARQPGAGSYLVGFSAFLAGAILYVAKFPGWVPHNALTEHAMQVGSALNLVFSALALAYHVKVIEERQRDAEHQARMVAVERDREVAQVRAEGLANALRAQDEERHRIARDLHDGLGHLLLRVKTAVGALATRREELEALVDEGMGTVRAVSQALFPTALDSLGLSLAMQSLAEASVKHTGVSLSLAVDDVDALVDPGACADVYRIVQQAIANALSHGKPRSLSVEACREGDEVLIAVTDDGAGFAREPKEGSGLRNMRQRAAVAGAALTIDSTPGEGTRIELRLPIVSERRAAGSSAPTG